MKRSACLLLLLLHNVASLVRRPFPSPTRKAALTCACALALSLNSTAWAAHRAHTTEQDPSSQGTLWGTNTPLPTTEAGIRQARTTRLALQKLLARKAQILQEKEEQARQAEAQAHLSAQQLARLQRKRATLAAARLKTEQRLAKVSTQLAQLSYGDTHLQRQEEHSLFKEAALLPALKQIHDLPELALLLSPSHGATQDSSAATHTTSQDSHNPVLTRALLLLRHKQNLTALLHLAQLRARLHHKQSTLTEQSLSIEATKELLQTKENLTETRTEQAKKDTEKAQQDLLRQQTLLTQARQSTESLTAIITSLAEKEAATRRHLLNERARLRKAHQKHKARALALVSQELSRNPGKGLLRGHAYPPVDGHIVTHWAQKTEAGPATGLTYKTAPAAAVIAPCTGQILFTGDFRSFGPMVILDCGQKQRLVLAGLGPISLQAGQIVQQGDHLGQMPNTNPLLFVQLRHGTQLVDPTKFF